MEIRTKKQLKFYIMADTMMNRGYFKIPFSQRVKNLIFPDYILLYLRLMRKCSYYSRSSGILSRVFFLFLNWRYLSLGIKLGFNIGYDCFGYGLVLPHYGSLGCGKRNRFGNYCVIHTLTSVTDNGKVIGDGLYLSKGAVITSKVCLGNNISVGANSVVNKNFTQDNIMIAGAPAVYIKESQPWYKRDGEQYNFRYNNVENLKRLMGL